MTETALVPVEPGAISDPADLHLLQEAGVFEPERLDWRPTRLEDVGWVVRKLKELRQEADDIARLAAARIKQLQAAEERMLWLWGADCERLTEDALPRRKDGTPLRKSVILADQGVTVRFRTVPAGPEITDEKALVDWIRDRWQRRDEHPIDDIAPLVEAVRTKREFRGAEALEELEAFPAETKIYPLAKEPVKQWAQAAPRQRVVETESGEVLAEILEAPGIEIREAREKWGWE